MFLKHGASPLAVTQLAANPPNLNLQPVARMFLAPPLLWGGKLALPGALTQLYTSTSRKTGFDPSWLSERKYTPLGFTRHIGKV